MSKVEEPQGQYHRTSSKVSLETYLEMIDDGTRRLEYHDGEVVDIKSATVSHGQICTNITGLIFNCLIDKDCNIYAGDRELWVQNCRKMYYPDHVIVCGKHKMKQMSKNVEATLNPSVVIEVLSDSTEKYDMGTKSRCYKTIDSLNQIIYVSQKEKYIRTLIRIKDEKAWKDIEFTEDDDSIPVADCAILLKDIYRRVEFENIPESASDSQNNDFE
jgi:Uma2 family endonuclease